MVERLLGWTISDRSAREPVISSLGADLELGAGLHQGSWGVGFHHAGEILVKKGPVSRPPSVARTLCDVPAAHAVLSLSSERAGSRQFHRIQPLRHGRWLFALSGASSLGRDFFDAASTRLDGFLTPGRWMDSITEAAMMIFMRALHAAGELDRSGLGERGALLGLRSGVQQVLTMAGRDELEGTAAFLHAEGTTWALSLGQPLSVHALDGARVSRLPRRHRHVRAALVTTEALGREPAHVLTAGWGVRVGPDARPEPFDLAVA